MLFLLNRVVYVFLWFFVFVLVVVNCYVVVGVMCRIKVCYRLGWYFKVVIYWRILDKEE